jgi:hypothetical protein
MTQWQIERPVIERPMNKCCSYSIQMQAPQPRRPSISLDVMQETERVTNILSPSIRRSKSFCMGSPQRPRSASAVQSPMWSAMWSAKSLAMSPAMSPTMSPAMSPALSVGDAFTRCNKITKQGAASILREAGETLPIQTVLSMLSESYQDYPEVWDAAVAALDRRASPTITEHIEKLKAT